MFYVTIAAADDANLIHLDGKLLFWKIVTVWLSHCDMLRLGHRIKDILLEFL